MCLISDKISEIVHGPGESFSALEDMKSPKGRKGTDDNME